MKTRAAYLPPGRTMRAGLDQQVVSPEFFRDPRRGCAPGKVDPDLFFEKERVDQAKEVCRRCPFDIRSECLAYADAGNERWGVWGGKPRRPWGGKFRPDKKRKPGDL